MIVQISIISAWNIWTHCVKFRWNWYSGSEKKLIIFKCHDCICAIISPWKKAWYIIKTTIPLQKDALCAQFIWEEVVNEFSLFAIISHWKKEVSVHMKKVEFPLTKQSLCQVWFKCLSCGCGIEKKTKMWKIYDSDDDDGQQIRWSDMLNWILGTCELKLQVCQHSNKI